jgi:hypothetical protein
LTVRPENSALLKHHADASSIAAYSRAGIAIGAEDPISPLRFRISPKIVRVRTDFAGAGSAHEAQNPAPVNVEIETLHDSLSPKPTTRSRTLMAISGARDGYPAIPGSRLSKACPLFNI